VAKIFICEQCGLECDLVEIDDGGYEEIWGAKIWCEQMTDYSSCCNAEYNPKETE
jgi:hypothetical protein